MSNLASASTQGATKLAKLDSEAPAQNGSGGGGAGRRWRNTSPTVLPSADGAGIHALTSAPIAPLEEHKSPENYYWTYKKRGLYAFGIVRAIRNIAVSHASDYIADGTFTSLAHLYDYFLASFPWLPEEIRRCRQSSL